MKFRRRAPLWKRLLFKLFTFAGKVAGKTKHAFGGCTWTYVKNKKGKFHKRICHWCGKREDRINGKWKYIGRYQRKKK